MRSRYDITDRTAKSPLTHLAVYSRFAFFQECMYGDKTAMNVSVLYR